MATFDLIRSGNEHFYLWNGNCMCACRITTYHATQRQIDSSIKFNRRTTKKTNCWCWIHSCRTIVSVIISFLLFGLFLSHFFFVCLKVKKGFIQLWCIFERSQSSLKTHNIPNRMRRAKKKDCNSRLIDW